MLLIVGLGNPGTQYQRNRHNVGFMAVDEIHRRHGFSPWRRRFQAEVAEGSLAGVKTLLMKPQTYMNESGRAVQEAVRFYKLELGDVIVLHDEVDLAAGRTRMKTGGGAAGHNGLRSIDACAGNPYRRLRIGVGHPGVKAAVPHYVLHDFSREDAGWLDPLIDAIALNAPLLAEGKDATFANKLHIALEGPPAKKGKPPSPAASAQPKPEGPSPSPARSADEKAEGPLARGLKKLFGQ